MDLIPHDFLGQEVPVSKKLQIPPEKCVNSAQFGQFSILEGQKHPKNFEVFDFRAKLLSLEMFIL